MISKEKLILLENMTASCLPVLTVTLFLRCQKRCCNSAMTPEKSRDAYAVVLQTTSVIQVLSLTYQRIPL